MTALALLIIVAPACQSNRTYRRIAAMNPMSKNVCKQPTSMVDVWQTFAQTTPEGKVVRGIAGRVHFYGDSRKKQAIKVDGDMTIFVFDGKETDPAKSKPLKVYKFRAKTLQTHYAYKKPLGHGYDFFLPFDELGGEEKHLCVMARFDDHLEGSLVLAPPVQTILKGTKPQNPETPFQQFLAEKSILGKAEKLHAAASAANGTNTTAGTASDKAAELDPSDIRQVAFRDDQSSSPTSDHSIASGHSDGPELNETRNVTTIRLNEQLTRHLSTSGKETFNTSSNHSVAGTSIVEANTDAKTATWTETVGDAVHTASSSNTETKNTAERKSPSATLERLRTVRY